MGGTGPGGVEGGVPTGKMVGSLLGLGMPCATDERSAPNIDGLAPAVACVLGATNGAAAAMTGLARSDDEAGAL